MQTPIVVIGAGPAGLTAAYLLAKEKIPVIVLEADPHYVGGIARTPTYKGFCFDIGGHRFFSKASEVEALWSEMLPNDMLVRPRSSRIFYRGQYFAYPLKALEAFRKLGSVESIRCFLSYLKIRIHPIKKVRSFADWVTNHFGERLFTIFFKTYTEKVWGMRCEEISADWAAQRIKGLSFFSAVMNALLPKKWFRLRGSKTIKTLIDTFRYPRKGPGMLWEACAEKIKMWQGEVRLGSLVTECRYDAAQKNWQVTYQDGQGVSHQLSAAQVISSAPLREVVVNYMPHAFSRATVSAANALQYRDFLIVILILKEQQAFNDNWIYVHDPHVDVARIQNFKSWSPEMVPDDSMCCYGMEYFCFKDDTTWALSDEALLQKASVELVKLKLANAADIVDGCVVRQLKAYPVYDSDYQIHVETIRKEIEEKFPSLHLVGRNGMHKYNNQDHAMMTAMLTVKNIIEGKRAYDVWCVNQDAEYIESGSAGERDLKHGLRQVPQAIRE